NVGIGSSLAEAIFSVLTAHSPSLNLMLAWLPLQNGMLAEAPQRQRVTRLRISYGLPSCDSILTPPRTQSGPLQPSAGSSTIPIDGGCLCSISFPVFLSCTTSLPAGQ